MLLTSGLQMDDIGRCREMGIGSFVIKPIKQSELFDAIVACAGCPTQPTAAPASDDSPPMRAGSGRPLRNPAGRRQPGQPEGGRAAPGEAGPRVTVAGNGREAVARSASRPFDIVLMDVQMPEMDGFEATAAIRDAGSRAAARTCRSLP